jgi:hypothetical protein
MADPSTFQEKRQFFRINFHTPIHYKSYLGSLKSQAAAVGARGISQNISQAGILFQTSTPPEISSVLWMNVDIRLLKICQEIESRALTFQNGLLGRVVRVEEDPENNAYDVGVCFLTKDQQNSQEVQQILAQVAK